MKATVVSIMTNKYKVLVAVVYISPKIILNRRLQRLLNQFR